MKFAIAKFRAVPSFRNACIGVVGAVSMVAAGSSFAADSVTGATAALATAQTGGETVGGSVVAVVCSLAVVGVIIALIRKV